jgi:hypothetical protein
MIFSDEQTSKKLSRKYDSYNFTLIFSFEDVAKQKHVSIR